MIDCIDRENLKALIRIKVRDSSKRAEINGIINSVPSINVSDLEKEIRTDERRVVYEMIQEKFLDEGL